ncbi:MAG: hypothetical protein ACFFG0_39955 [Candidatus Thorarchaeota archaeon]
MSSERKIDPFAALILVISIIGIILLATQYFASFYLGAGQYRHSCLDCEYATGGDLAAQIIVLILLIIQIVVALNDLLPKRFIDKNLDKWGIILGLLTILWVIIGIASFGIVYSAYEWWPETGFYSSIIAGIVNTILFFLKFRNK